MAGLESGETLRARFRRENPSLASPRVTLDLVARAVQSGLSQKAAKHLMTGVETAAAAEWLVWFLADHEIGRFQWDDEEARRRMAPLGARFQSSDLEPLPPHAQRGEVRADILQPGSEHWQHLWNTTGLITGAPVELEIRLQTWAAPFGGIGPGFLWPVVSPLLFWGAPDDAGPLILRGIECALHELQD